MKRTWKLAAAALAATLALGACTPAVDPTPADVAGPLFSDTGFGFYLDGDDPAGTESSVVGAFDGSTVTVEGGNAAQVVFEGYPAWWSGGVGFAQKPPAATGYYDLSGVSTIEFEIKSATILPAELYILIQWYGSAAGSGGLFKVPLSDLDVTSIADWTTVSFDLADATIGIDGNEQPRYNDSGAPLTQVLWAEGAAYVDTAFALAWDFDSVDGSGVVSGPLSAGDAYLIRNIAFVDASAAAVDIAANVEFVVPLDAPADPTAADADVISILTTRVYPTVATNVSWHPSWKGTGSVSDLVVDGKNLKQYTIPDFDIIEMDAIALGTAAMTHFHIDVWSPDIEQVKVKLVDFGADGAYDGGDDTEKELIFDLVAGVWSSLDIPLSDFQVSGGLTNPANHFKQIVLSPAGTLFVTNIYFHK